MGKGTRERSGFALIDSAILRVGGLGLLAALAWLLALVPPPPASSASLTAPGQLYAFGYNGWGQLGNTTNNNSQSATVTPTLVPLPEAAGPVVQAAVGWAYSLALTKSGEVFSFGEDYTGQLGDSPSFKRGQPNPVPTLLSPLEGASGPVNRIATGFGHSLALTSTGQLYAWGGNFGGVLGNTTNMESEEPNPTPTLVTLPGVSGPIVQIAGGRSQTLAVTSTGQLYAFGTNYYGQLGSSTNNGISKNGYAVPNPTPTQVILPAMSGPVIEVAAGANHSLALTSTGQLYAFGKNWNGQLGNATNNETEAPNPTPTLVNLPGASGQIIQIAAGENHSLALTSTGQLYAFGENFYGQLGNASNVGSRRAANPTPTVVNLPGAGGQIIQIAAGESHSLALTSTGQLYAFGDNRYGQLGNATNDGTEEPNPTPTLVAFPGGATIETIARGPSADHTLAIIADLAIENRSLPAATVGIPYEGQLRGTGGTRPYRWSAVGLPPGLSIDPETGVISGTPVAPDCLQAPCTPSPIMATFTVTDDSGVEAQAPLSITINSPPPRAPARSSPVISSAHQSSSRWREGDALAQISRKPGHRPPVGTTFSFSLNEDAEVAFNFTSNAKDDDACSSAKGGVSACRNSAGAGTLTLMGRSGTNRVAFDGRLSHSKQLRPGRYTLAVTATDAAGSRSVPVAMHFTIVK